MATGTLFIVPTPIGNLKDITFRAVDTLRESDYIIAEDTRVTQKLLNHYSITSKMISYHKFNEKERELSIVDMLKTGARISLVSDAGTPLLSDPGFNIVKACAQEGIRVEALPGASSILPAVVLSGFDPGRFAFYGFLEKTEKAKKEELKHIKKSGYVTVLFESPNRVIDTLKDIAAEIPTAEVAVVKEISKIYEKVLRGKPLDVAAMITEDMQKGEFVIVISAVAEENPAVDEVEIEKMLKEYIAGGMPASQAVKEVSNMLKMPKNDIYKISTKMKKSN